MSDLPIEIHEKIIRYAPWDLFCAFVFASKAHHKICKSIDLRKYTHKYDYDEFTVYILPNGVFHGKYVNLCAFVRTKATYAYGRLHGKCMQSIHYSFDIVSSEFINGNLYQGTLLYEKSGSVHSETASTDFSTASKLPYGKIMRVARWQLFTIKHEKNILVTLCALFILGTAYAVMQIMRL